MILAIESGADLVSVAIGDLEHFSKVTLSAERNSEELLRAVDYLRSSRKESKISAVSVCIGPGSYTGLRVGLACAQGIACGLNVPLIGVSSFLIGLFFRPVSDGQSEASCLLREGELANCKFSISQNGTLVEQLSSVQFCSSSTVNITPANAEGLLKAALTIKDFTSFSDSQSHFIRTSGKQPLPLMYLKPVQAKTLVERGILV